MKSLKQFALIALAICMIATISGCNTISGGDEGSASISSVSKSQIPSRDAVKVNDIDITIENGVVNGDRRVLFSYRNNSEYAITDLEVRYALKPGVTDEEYEAAISDINTGWSQSLLDRSNEWNTIEISAEYYGMVDPGAESPQERVSLNSIYLSDASQIDLFEPSIMRICFLCESNIYEETYDFKTGSYTLSKNVIDTKQWLETELSALIPHPDEQMVIETDSGSTYYSYRTFGTSSEEYNAYVKACKEMGFTDSIVESDIRFYANSADGLHTIDVTPAFPREGNMNVRVEAND